MEWNGIVLKPKTPLKDCTFDDESTLILKAAPNAFIPGLDFTVLKTPEISDELYCPISLQIYCHPVQYTFDAVNYYIMEEKTFETLQNQSGLCPFTRCRLDTIVSVEPEVKKIQELATFFDKYADTVYYDYFKEKQYENYEKQIFQKMIFTQRKAEDEIKLEDRMHQPHREPAAPTVDDLEAMRLAQDEESGYYSLELSLNSGAEEENADDLFVLTVHSETEDELRADDLLEEAFNPAAEEEDSFLYLLDPTVVAPSNYPIEEKSVRQVFDSPTAALIVSNFLNFNLDNYGLSLRSWFILAKIMNRLNMNFEQAVLSIPAFNAALRYWGRNTILQVFANAAKPHNLPYLQPTDAELLALSELSSTAQPAITEEHEPSHAPAELSPREEKSFEQKTHSDAEQQSHLPTALLTPTTLEQYARLLQNNRLTQNILLAYIRYISRSGDVRFDWNFLLKLMNALEIDFDNALQTMPAFAAEIAKNNAVIEQARHDFQNQTISPLASDQPTVQDLEFFIRIAQNQDRYSGTIQNYLSSFSLFSGDGRFTPQTEDSYHSSPSLSQGSIEEVD